MRYLIFACVISIAWFLSLACFASGGTEQATMQSHTATEQTWLIGQIIELQTKSAKLEATLQQQNVNASDLKTAEAELNRLQVQIVELGERVSSLGDNQAKELSFASKRVDDVLWLTNTWGFVLSIWGIFAAIGALYLGVKAKDTAIQEAREAAQSYIETESQSLLQKQEERFTEELNKYSSKFDELHDQLEIQGKLLHAQTIFDKARDDFNDKNYEAALLAFDKVLRYTAGDRDSRLKTFACRAFFAKSATQDKLNQPEQVIKTYDALIAYVGDDKTPALLVQVARAMVNKGVTQGQLNQSEQEIQTYNELIANLGDHRTPDLREQVAKAMFNKGVTQAQLDQHEQAIQTYDALIAYVGDDKTPAMRGQVAKAMFNKGVRQSQLNQPAQEIKTYDALIAYVGDDKTPPMREHVADAHNGIGFTLLCQSKQLTQKGDVEGANKLVSQAFAKFELAIREIASGMYIGNKAYALALSGQLEESERIFTQALRAKVDGGEQLYQGTLKDIDIHPIQQDGAFREIVERQWAVYKQERKDRGK